MNLHVEAPPRGITPLDLKRNECRFPSGDGPFTFCGRVKRDDSSYCREHHALCYIPPRDRR